MGYRSNNEKSRVWRKWVLMHQQALDECGLPLRVLQDEDHWWDFLESGFLDHHDDPTRFDLEQLSQTQKKKLLEFLEAELAPEDQPSANVLKWLKEELKEAPKRSNRRL